MRHLDIICFLHEVAETTKRDARVDTIVSNLWDVHSTDILMPSGGNPEIQRFIEENFPIGKVNILSSKEASIWGLPRIHNIHTWFARRPAGTARTLTLASILPESTSIDIFEQVSGISEAYRSGKVIYVVHPKRENIAKLVREQLGKEPEMITVLDPMAGGGSIPLEALRMGFRTIAVEYNPVAYLILKATLEYPAKYADAGLFEETLKAAKQFIAKATERIGKVLPDKRWITTSSQEGLSVPSVKVSYRFRALHPRYYEEIAALSEGT